MVALSIAAYFNFFSLIQLLNLVLGSNLYDGGFCKFVVCVWIIGIIKLINYFKLKLGCLYYEKGTKTRESQAECRFLLTSY